MVARRKVWEYGLLVTAAPAVGIVVAAVVAALMPGATDAVAGGANDLVSTIIPGAAGLIAVGVTLDIGLRRLHRPRAKAGW
jgi:hypothetical protein